MIPDPAISNLPVADYSHWGYLIVFFATILEAMPFGFAVPGHILVIFSGFLAKLKIINLAAVIIVAGTGAALGDWINYYLGRRFGYNFLKKIKNYFSFHEYALDKVKMLLGAHPAKTLILGRFNPITRSLSPFLAGATSMDFFKFYKLSLAGGFIWAATSVLLGYIFGSGYEIAAKRIGAVTFFALAIIILSFAIYKFFNRYQRVFARYHLFYLAINFFSLYIFFKMLEDILTLEPIARFDIFVIDNIKAIWSSFMNKFMVAGTVLLSPEFLLGMSIFILLYFLRKRRFRDFWFLSLSMISGSLFAQLIKIVVRRARPEHGLIGASSYSFPSAHAVVAVIFFGALIYLWHNRDNNRLLRQALYIAAAFLIITAGFSRIYLNVHRVTDVIAGYALGIFCLTLLILIFDYFSNKKPA